MSKRTLRIVSGVLAAWMLLLSAGPALARPLLTPRRTFGILFLGGSALMAKRAIDFRRDANDLYERYELASSASEAEDLYSRTQDRDTKSQMSGVLSVMMLVGGLRLLLTSGSDNVPKMDRGMMVGENVRVDLQSDVQQRRVGLTVNRDF